MQVPPPTPFTIEESIRFVTTQLGAFFQRSRRVLLLASQGLLDICRVTLTFESTEELLEVHRWWQRVRAGEEEGGRERETRGTEIDVNTL